MKTFATTIAALAATLCTSLAYAQTYPNRPLRLIIPYGTGGATDAIGRLIATRLGETMGQPMVIENKPGANSAIGTADLARSRPDGYSFLIVSSAHAVNPFVSKDVPYNVRKDFQAVTLLTRMPSVFVVHPSVPAQNVRDVIELARKEPQKYFYAIAGGLSNGHVSMERFKLATGASIEPVMFKGGGPAALEVAAGRVQMMMIAPPAIKPFLESNRLRVIAYTGKTPAGMPAAQTMVEAGYPQLEAYEWLGMLTVAGTPRALVDRVHGEVAGALKSPNILNAINGQSQEVVADGPDRFQAFIDAELDKMSKLTATVKLSAE